MRERSCVRYHSSHCERHSLRFTGYEGEARGSVGTNCLDDVGFMKMRFLSDVKPEKGLNAECLCAFEWVHFLLIVREEWRRLCLNNAVMEAENDANSSFWIDNNSADALRHRRKMIITHTTQLRIQFEASTCMSETFLVFPTFTISLFNHLHYE